MINIKSFFHFFKCRYSNDQQVQFIHIPKESATYRPHNQQLGKASTITTYTASSSASTHPQGINICTKIDSECLYVLNIQDYITCWVYVQVMLPIFHHWTDQLLVMQMV